MDNYLKDGVLKGSLKFEYLGLFLTAKSKILLREILPNENMFGAKMHKMYLDHCTIFHTNQVNDSNREKVNEILTKYSFNQNYKFNITHIGWNDKAMAFKLNIPENMCLNKNPHITICTFDNNRPFLSNTIEKWIELKPIEVEMYLNLKIF